MQITKHALCFYQTQHLKMQKTVNEASGSLYLSCCKVFFLKPTLVVHAVQSKAI